MLVVQTPTVEQPNKNEQLILTDVLGMLAIASIRGIGYWTLRRLVENRIKFAELIQLENGEQVREILKSAGARLSGSKDQDWNIIRNNLIDKALKMQEQLSSEDIRILLYDDPNFPRSLNDLSEPPYWLFVQGDVHVLREPSLTIVGTRKPTRDGIFLADFVGACLAELRCPTISGLAMGIDQEIHSMSLRFRVPTVAVLGNGILIDFPKGSEPLRASIVRNGGAIVSEYLPRDSFSKENFVWRNRIQAALGRALIPVEWAAKSGTAHTVRFAQQLQRPIACLRMPDWETLRTPYRTVSGSNARLFTIPGEEGELRNFLMKSLQMPYVVPPTQQELKFSV